MKLQELPAKSWLWAQKHWFISTTVVLIGLCMFMTRDRTVTWEEEVPLNTGETIIVKRSGTYSLRMQPGSPFDIRLSPEPVSTIKFEYKGKLYSFQSEGGLQVLAIGPDGRPNLVSHAGGDWGTRNRYSCDPPYYVQFQPSLSGKDWTWPPRIEPWLYHHPTNLVLGIAELKFDGKRMTAADRQTENASAYGYANAKFIDPAYFFDGCIRSN
jgi:hypothetical protein